MGKVVIGMSMSLDDTVATTNDDVRPLMKWYFSWRAYLLYLCVPGTDMAFQTSRKD